MRELSLIDSRLDKRYEVRERLGRGSYAEIFVADDTIASNQSNHRQVVIKALNVFLQDDLDQDLERTLVENFQNEATALDRVRHPNIISRLGHGTARDLKGMLFHYIILEYLEGGDLQRASREQRLNLKRSVGYLEQICAGLGHAHRNGIIHRDIKPHNLLLTKDCETVKIADFGVARINQSDAPITRVGTNIYAPPEHSPLTMIDGAETSALLTPAADIYSLAKSAYVLLTGETPRFYANHQITDLPLASRNESWAVDFLDVLRKATLDNASERYQSVDEFWQALEPVRRIAYENETVTKVRPKLDSAPQPHISKGYTPVAPRRPDFNSAAGETKLRLPLIEEKYPARGGASISGDAAVPVASQKASQIYLPMDRVEDYWPQSNELASGEAVSSGIIPIVEENDAPIKKKKGLMRRLIIYGILIGLFFGALYGTQLYVQRFVPSIGWSTSAKTGIAKTDIYLRSEPTVENAPIGVVTKDSKIRILKMENNWYQVDIIEQGRQRAEQTSNTNGWLYGKYVNID